MNRVSRYFLDLGFYPGQVELGAGLARKRLIWTIAVYLLLFSGFLSRQCIDISKTPIEVSVSNLRWTVVGASALVALALIAPFTRWFNKKRRKPSWEHVLWAFSFGFFVNLSGNLIWKKFF